MLSKISKFSRKIENDKIFKSFHKISKFYSNMTSLFPFVKKKPRVISSYYLISTCADECD